MPIGQERLNYYCEQLSSHSNPLLASQERKIGLHSTDPSLSSDFSQGRLLNFISKIIRPKRILEIGTFWGYATICFAEGLCSEGQIHTLEKNSTLRPILEEIFENAKITDKVKVFYGPALETMNTLNLHSYDLFFVDAGKREYYQYYEIIIQSAKKGSIIILDNVLWKGSVINQNLKGIPKSMHDLNQKIKSDQRVENFILPLRDGLNILTVL